MIIKIDEVHKSINRIVLTLKKGGVIAIPTDTVYGLAVDCANEGAVSRLIGLKHRKDKPFTFFMPKSAVEKYVVISKRRIIDFFIPGPLTAILKKRAGISLPLVEDKAGIRIPQHGVARGQAHLRGWLSQRPNPGIGDRNRSAANYRAGLGWPPPPMSV